MDFWKKSILIFLGHLKRRIWRSLIYFDYHMFNTSNSPILITYHSSASNLSTRHALLKILILTSPTIARRFAAAGFQSRFSLILHDSRLKDFLFFWILKKLHQNKMVAFSQKSGVCSFESLYLWRILIIWVEEVICIVRSGNMDWKSRKTFDLFW